MKKRYLLLIALLLPCFVEITPVDGEAKVVAGPDLIVHNAKVLTVDAKFSIAQAIAVKGDRIVMVGNNEAVMNLAGRATKVIDAKGKTLMPGLYDSHTHPLGAATSEFDEELPYLKSLEDVFAYIRAKAAKLPEGEWIVLRFAFPTRFKEARFPTLAELDAVAPKHPVLHNAGPASMVNSMALKVSGVTKETKNPSNGVIVKDPKTGELTGMLRNATGVLKGVPGGKATGKDQREAVKKLFALYNSFGITSISDRSASRGGFDLYHDLLKKDELTVRINVCPNFSPYGTREDIAKRFDNLPGKDGRFGPTGRGGIWIRIGPIKFFLDGGMLNGTAYMRQPWPPGPTYQIVEKDYRGLLFTPPEQVKIVAEEAAKRGWSVTAHTAGEGAMDVLLDGYEFVDRIVPIKDLRFCITHANFPSQQNLERCKRLGVVADVQPAWLYKDGATLEKVLGQDRIRWFQPYKSWLKYTTIGGGSDHMIKLDPRKATNPWDPWLGIETAVTRKLESGKVLMPEECLSREEALRLYTINNAYLGREEKDKGTLEPGKLADFILIDRDYLTTPDIGGTRVLQTFVGGKMVYERKE
ncbi:MAG: amidohydrolase [Planctomycetes bacterium]|nr:amidohydrolase [Planctomycetota bacterium]